MLQNLLTIGFMAVAIKAIMIGSEFNFWHWYKYGNKYTRWYYNRPKFIP